MTLDKVLALCGERLGRLLGGNLISLTVYGSAAGPDYREGVSDINLVLVLKTMELDTLDQVQAFTRSMRRHRLAAPLLMTPEHIQSSLDVFPIEFLEIKEQHRVLQGEDYFSRVAISTANLRHETEHELRGRMIRMRESYLEAGRKPSWLRNLILSGHRANLPAFRAALRLKGLVPPTAKDEVETTVCRVFNLAPTVFEQIRCLRHASCRASRASLRKLLEHYLDEVNKLAQAVDAL